MSGDRAKKVFQRHNFALDLDHSAPPGRCIYIAYLLDWAGGDETKTISSLLREST